MSLGLISKTEKGSNMSEEKQITTIKRLMNHGQIREYSYGMDLRGHFSNEDLEALMQHLIQRHEEQNS